MASTPKFYDRVAESSTTTGTGTYTLAGALTGFQTFAAVANSNSCYYCAQEVDANGNPSGGWEVGLGTYTASGTTLSRDTILASSNSNAAVSWSAGTRRIFLVNPAVQVAQSTLIHAAGGADADQTMQPNTMYVVDISGYSADRTYTLPAVAAVGDRVGIMLSVGDDAKELIITAASGDTLNGISGGTEWSRVFITGEVVIMRCVAASATWVVEYDGRIAQQCTIALTTQCDGESASTSTAPTAASSAGAWTTRFDNASIASTSNGRIIPRRTGKYLVRANGVSKDAVTDGQWYQLSITIDATAQISTLAFSPATQQFYAAVGPIELPLTEGSYFGFLYASSEGGRGVAATTTYAVILGAVEVFF